MDPCYVLKRRMVCISLHEVLCRVINTCGWVVRTHSKPTVHEPLLPKQRECYLQQKILYELSGHIYLFVELDEHLFDGEVYAINHFVKLLKNIIICFLKIRAKRYNSVLLKTPLRKNWVENFVKEILVLFTELQMFQVFANTNKFRHLLRNNRYPFKWRRPKIY